MATTFLMAEGSERMLSPAQPISGEFSSTSIVHLLVNRQETKRGGAECLELVYLMYLIYGDPLFCMESSYRTPLEGGPIGAILLFKGGKTELEVESNS